MFDAGHREGYSFVAASSLSLSLVSAQSMRVGRLLRGYEIPAVGRGSFPRTGRKARERKREREKGRKGPSTPGENLNRGYRDSGSKRTDSSKRAVGYPS